MSAAIYQRARPIHWDEVIGQEHVKDVLRPALERGRIGHAYLFSGPRGVGKTTTARLIAMTVNCEAGPGVVKPCGGCEACRLVIAGRFPDVLEIDAASNNSVDDVRDLRDKVALQPMRGTRKVYILDEAHMMSKSAFNALLKTLEEPPEHVVFVLATTEPERLPPTILSRCQHYRFRRLSVDEIAGKLAALTLKEGVTAEPEALRLVARSADGAMRDGESLLERLLAAGEPALSLRTVEATLGLPPQDRVAALALGLARGETGAVLETLSKLYADGFAPRTVTERTKIALRDLLHGQLGLAGAGGGLAHEPLAEGLLLRLIRALDEEDARFARASDLIALEMAFTQALLAGQGGGTVAGGPVQADAGLAARVAALERSLRESGPRPARSALPDFEPTRPVSRLQPEPEVASEPRAPADNVAPALAPPPAIPATRPGPVATWGDVVNKAPMRLRAFLKEGEGTVGDGVVVLSYGPKHGFHAGNVERRLDEVAEVVRAVLGAHFGLELRLPDGSKKKL